MMKRILHIGIVALVLLVLLLAQAPASWLDQALLRASHGFVGLANAKGSIWRGNGVIQAILPSGRVETLEAVRWTLDPWALFALRLHLSMLSERGGQPVVDATLTPTSLTLSEFRLNAPAALLGALSPTIRAADVTGLITVQASGVRLDQQASSGDGSLLWLGAGSSLTPVYPLGNYRVDLKGSGRGLDFTLSTLGGSLTLTGGGQWQPGQPLSFKATAIPSPDQARQLVPLLRIIGKETGAGSYQLKLGENAGLAGS